MQEVGKCSEREATTSLLSELAGASVLLKTQWDFAMDQFLLRMWLTSFMSLPLFEIQLSDDG